MNKLAEFAIEKFAIELLEKHGYQFIYAFDIDIVERIVQ